MTILPSVRTAVLAVSLTLAAAPPVVPQNTAAFERSQTEKFLGVTVKDHPTADRTSAYEEIDPNAPASHSVARRRPLTGPTPSPSYEQRTSVIATAPDGTVYQGFSGRFTDGMVHAGPGDTSSNANPRQRYATHHGYGYNPADVFIGMNDGGKIRTSLFFRDVGSHDTAPYHFTVDATGLVHLIVADVNISDNNELQVYSVIGNPKTGKWLDAVLLDRRGFTSSSHPWSGASASTVHLLWNWGDATFDKSNPNMGLFYVDWTPAGYGKKVRVIKGLVESYDAAVDPKTGHVVVVAAVGTKVYLASRTKDGVWRKPAEISPVIRTQYSTEVSIRSASAGSFVVRTTAEETSERLVQIR